jgi:hypothetical protein
MLILKNLLNIFAIYIFQSHGVEIEKLVSKNLIAKKKWSMFDLTNKTKHINTNVMTDAKWAQHVISDNHIKQCKRINKQNTQ